MISKRPSQKFGIETPTSAISMPMASAQEPRLIADITPKGTPNRKAIARADSVSSMVAGS